MSEVTLDELLKRAASYKMTLAEVRAQHLSFIAGQSGLSRAKVLEILPELAPDKPLRCYRDGMPD